MGLSSNAVPHYPQELSQIRSTDFDDFNLDSVLRRLLEVHGAQPETLVHLLEAEIRWLCTKAREICMSQRILLELEAPIKVNTRL